MLTPTQEKIAAGMNPLTAFLTEATCGEACWNAREEICRCSCGGKNHGCLRVTGSEQPVRSAKIDGYRYELVAVGKSGLYAEAEKINRAAPPKSVGQYTFSWRDTDAGAPARVKKASKSQLAGWMELGSFKEQIEEAQNTPQTAPIVWLRMWPYLLWKRVN